MSQFQVSTLTDLTDRAIVAGASISSTDHEAWRNDVETTIQEANDAIQAVANCQAGSTIAWNLQGEIFFDTDTKFWLGDPDGSGHDDEFLTRLTAYNHALATGGTATHKLMGAINVLTTANARTTAGDFTSYTLPANTLGVNGQAVRITWWGTRSGSVGTFSLQPKLGTANIGTAFASTINSLTDWMVQCLIVRTGAATQDIFFYVVPNSDATGSTTLASFDASQTEDLTAALAIALDLTAISAGTVTQEGMLVELLQ